MAPVAKRQRIELDQEFYDQQTLTYAKVVTGLATLQDAISTLSTAYIKFTNGVLGENNQGLDINLITANLADNPLLGSIQNLAARAASPPKTAGDAAGDEKKRKKRQHDPNAPKRPLTPFFLYMQTARPIIANDLGADVAKGAVSTEGTRRWSTMIPEDKQLWTNAYKDNLRLYNARMHSYKIGRNLDAKDMSDQDALQYANDHHIVADASADAHLAGEATTGALLDEDAEGEPEKEPTPPPKATPKPKGGRKAKPAKATPSVPEAIVPPAPVAPAKEDKPASPEKKRKRVSKKAEEVVLVPEPEETVVETPKSGAKPRKKKAKADA